MTRREVAWVLVLGMAWIAAGCMSEEEAHPNGASDTGMLTVDAAWARPGTEGGMSAVYFRIENGTAAADTLDAVRSDAADAVEMHESFDADDGTRGMRPVDAVPVPAGWQVAFAPGGLHVMLIQLNRELEVGDSLVVDLEFAQDGIRSMHVPVRVEPPSP